MWQTLLQSVIEIQSLIPDSILFGSLFLYFLTQNVSYGIFAVFLVEVILSHRLIGWMFTQTTGPSRSPDVTCRVGYKMPQFQYHRIFAHEAYPSYGIFSVTAIATYLSLATNEFAETMNQMGQGWETRKIVAYVFVGLFLVAFLASRWYVGCENVNEICIAMVLAFVTGMIFYQIHRRVFGVESVNFLGLPYLVKKSEDGSPIYVCTVNTDQPTTHST